MSWEFNRAYKIRCEYIKACIVNYWLEQCHWQCSFDLSLTLKPYIVISLAHGHQSGEALSSAISYNSVYILDVRHMDQIHTREDMFAPLLTLGCCLTNVYVCLSYNPNIICLQAYKHISCQEISQVLVNMDVLG